MEITIQMNVPEDTVLSKTVKGRFSGNLKQREAAVRCLALS